MLQEIFRILSLSLYEELIFDEIQEQVDQKKCEAETPYSPTPIFEDEIFDGCTVIFQTTIEPRLEGELMDKTYDDELIGKFVQVVGHIHILTAGNTMLSMHIVEPAYNSLNGFDPIS